MRQGSIECDTRTNNIGNIERASEFADYWDQADVWSLLGKAQLCNQIATLAVLLLRAWRVSRHLRLRFDGGFFLQFRSPFRLFLQRARFAILASALLADHDYPIDLSHLVR